jgi:hypothetical protein
MEIKKKINLEKRIDSQEMEIKIDYRQDYDWKKIKLILR